MSSYTVFQQLRNTFATLYVDLEDSKRVVQDAGLSPIVISFDHRAINNWHNILNQAIQENRVDALLTVACQEYGGNRNLLQAVNAYRRLYAQGDFLAPTLPLDADDQQQRAYRYRQAILHRVHEIWIEGALEESLHGAALIALGLEKRQDAVPHPWDMVIQRHSTDEKLLPMGTRISDVFDEPHQSLLILGEPGSGKTTVLLELTRDLLVRAVTDPAKPIPVVLNLSSWSLQRQSMAEWLVKEIKLKYDMHTDIVQSWIQEEKLVLLLDGLDEVKPEHRDECVEKLNKLREDNKAPMVVCCRIADYEALTHRLTLEDAVLLKPLTSKQIEDYLDAAGPKLAALRKLLQEDAALFELAQSPLFLSIMTLVYESAPMESVIAGKAQSVDERRQQLFDAYIEKMFDRTVRTRGEAYPKQQTIRWLTWLAQQMAHHGQSELYIERIQPQWLSTNRQRLLYAIGIRAVGALSFLGAGFLGYFVAMIFAMLVGKEINSLYAEMIMALTVGLTLASAFLLASLLASKFSPLLSVTLTVAGMSAVISVILRHPIDGVGLGLVSGLPTGLVGIGFANDIIEIAELLSWSWRRGLRGLLVGLIPGIALGWLVGSVSGPVYLSGDMLTIALPIAFVCMLAFGFTRSQPIHARLAPNQGFHRSARNAIYVGVGVLLASLLLGVPIGVMDRDLANGLIISLIFGLPIALTVSFLVGGSCCVQHIVLRLLLCYHGDIAWNLTRFLDYAAERILLQKRGGGYTFVHSLLLEHFVRRPLATAQVSVT